MRKLLVKHFFGYYHNQSNIPKEIAKGLLLVILAIIAMTGFIYPLIIVIIALLGALLFLLPIKTITSSALRASRACWPVFSLLFILLAATRPFSWEWYQVAAIVMIIVLCWFSWSWFGLGYFQLFKVKYSELDTEQKADYDHDKNIYNLKAAE
jgi:membrane-bound ClpP family serine protease